MNNLIEESKNYYLAFQDVTGIYISIFDFVHMAILFTKNDNPDFANIDYQEFSNYVLSRNN